MACIVFSFQVERIAPTILEAVNKVGSMFNGPLLALFVIALLLRNVPQRFALSGFVLGLVANLGLALGAPQVSWLWWNAGRSFVVSMLFAVVAAMRNRLPAHNRYQTVINTPHTRGSIAALCIMAGAMTYTLLPLCCMTTLGANCATPKRGKGVLIRKAKQNPKRKLKREIKNGESR